MVRLISSAEVAAAAMPPPLSSSAASSAPAAAAARRENEDARSMIYLILGAQHHLLMQIVERRFELGIFGIEADDLGIHGHDDVRLDALLIDIASVRRDIAGGRDLH